MQNENQNKQMDPIDQLLTNQNTDSLENETFKEQLTEFENVLKELVESGELETFYNDDGELMYQHATTVDYDDDVYDTE